MDYSRNCTSSESVKQGAISPASPSFRRSNILTPCRRVGLSRKSRFTVPSSPVRESNEASVRKNETCCSPIMTSVTSKGIGNSKRIAASTDESDTSKQSSTGGMILGKYNFKSPGRSLTGKRVSACNSANLGKLELITKITKNLGTTAFSNFPSECCSSKKQSSFASTGDCDTWEHNENIVTKKLKTENTNTWHNCDSQTESNVCVTTIDNCTGQLEYVDCANPLDSETEIADDVVVALHRVKEREDVLSYLEQNYHRKQGLIAELQEVTEQWLIGGQAAAVDLLAKYKHTGISVTMAQLLTELSISVLLLRYNPEEEEFQ